MDDVAQNVPWSASFAYGPADDDGHAVFFDLGDLSAAKGPVSQPGNRSLCGTPASLLQSNPWPRHHSGFG